jgi:hypothetical protein
MKIKFREQEPQLDITQQHSEQMLELLTTKTIEAEGQDQEV